MLSRSAPCVASSSSATSTMRSRVSRASHGGGTFREADFGGTRWIEEMIAWDEPARWAWTVTRASVPLATAQVEAFELTETGDGTHVRWTLALEPRLLGRVSAPLAARTIPRLFRRAMDNLGTYVHGAR